MTAPMFPDYKYAVYHVERQTLGDLYTPVGYYLDEGAAYVAARLRGPGRYVINTDGGDTLTVVRVKVPKERTIGEACEQSERLAVGAAVA